ncbi:LytR/AlgR family response regulator transcription factor [Emticicia sp. 17c]|uniref:LytR/AlgR family response regulator transcription factor n=1 Tax=Emticicia sp. 17c TaxID=3127704 RepID=UPI00301DDDE2
MPTKIKTIEKKTRISLGIPKNVCPETILMLKAEVNYTHVFLYDGSYFLSSITLGVLEKRLNGFNFFRLNRSVLINLSYLDNFSISAKKIGLVRLKQNNQEFQVSRRRKPLLIKALIADNK